MVLADEAKGSWRATARSVSHLGSRSRERDQDHCHSGRPHARSPIIGFQTRDHFQQTLSRETSSRAARARRPPARASASSRAAVYRTEASCGSSRPLRAETHDPHRNGDADDDASHLESRPRQGSAGSYMSRCAFTPEPFGLSQGVLCLLHSRTNLFAAPASAASEEVRSSTMNQPYSLARTVSGIALIIVGISAVG